MEDWQKYGTFMQQLWEGRDILPKAAKAEVHRLTANVVTPQEKIDILYRYLQENMRYVSV